MFSNPSMSEICVCQNSSLRWESPDFALLDRIFASIIGNSSV